MKLEQAARQALEALEEAREMIGYPANMVLYEEELALREALAEQEKPLYRKVLREMLDAHEQAEPEPVAWQGAEEWEPLAFQLCADENGEESCNELLWDGGVIPEPWGERWLKYEDEAKRMIEYVRKYAAPVRTKDLTDDEISDVFDSVGSWKETLFGDLPVVFARAVIAADREKNK